MKIKEVSCKNCGIKYPENWKTCPICGEKAKPKRRWWLLVVCAVVLVAVAAAAVLMIQSNARKEHYNQGQKLMDREDYLEAEEAYLAAGNYKDAPELAEEARKAWHYQQGEDAFEAGDYLLAEEEFLAAGDYADAAHQAAQCRLAEHYRLGCEALDQGDYDGAIAAFEAAGDYCDAADLARSAAQARDYEAALICMNLGDYAAARELLISVGDYENAVQYEKECCYYMASDAMDRGRYAEAIDLFEQSEGFYDAYTRTEECATILGKQYLTQADYQQALTYFQKANDAFVGSEELSNYILICKSEVALAQGKLTEGMNYFDKIPNTFRPAEYDVYTRRITLNKYKSFRNIEGTWNSSSYDIKITKTGGGWVNSYYYPIGTLTDMKMTVSCTLNADGTVDIKGEVFFYYFNTYPDGNYTDKSKTLTFHIPNQTYAPSGYALDENTLIYLSGNCPRLFYQANVDDGTASAISDVTYNNKY